MEGNNQKMKLVCTICKSTFSSLIIDTQLAAKEVTESLLKHIVKKHPRELSDYKTQMQLLWLKIDWMLSVEQFGEWEELGEGEHKYIGNGDEDPCHYTYCNEVKDNKIHGAKKDLRFSELYDNHVEDIARSLGFLDDEEKEIPDEDKDNSVAPVELPLAASDQDHQKETKPS